MKSFCPTMGECVIAMVAFTLPFYSPDALRELPLLKHTGDDPLEEVSVALFQYVSLVYIACLITDELRRRTCVIGVRDLKVDGHNNFRLALLRILFVRTLYGVIIATVLTGAAVAFYDGRHGEGLAIPLFFLQTLPLTLMVLITAGAFRAGTVSLRALVVVLASLLLLPAQFAQDWLILLLLIGSFPAMVVWAHVILRRMVAAGNN